MPNTLEQLRAQLMARIDTDNLLEIDKVERLVMLRKLDKACDEAIERDGATITIKNGTQRFIKSHPALNDKAKLNSQMITLEKSIDFKEGNLVPSPAASPVEGKSDGYSPSDLT
ncbi:hypothetical protein B1B04_24385 [Lysinibacillus sp. KCTC 33748]|uniref:hypothetical protein n=1 Tax=unclassified Lysinibacillus TaxID=2636778 RepID=UPI0009A74D92|nr:MULTISPECIES: hypothetical protein [unclassified Lysinibacillus]OXS66086.1 hypothetical protein B1B04_24385 [Lysinibacillus sp. KCTC 33748]SKC18420.1 hypothetical protein SAMN06295926_13718 [Lysinibacillus sp. AC-3]